MNIDPFLMNFLKILLQHFSYHPAARNPVTSARFYTASRMKCRGVCLAISAELTALLGRAENPPIWATSYIKREWICLVN